MSGKETAITTPQEGGLTDLLRARYREIQGIVPSHVTPERLCKIGLLAARSPGLQRCSAESIVEGIVQAASLGFEVNDGTQRAFLIPYGQKARLVLGYRGVIDLAMRSPRVAAIWAFAVYEGDDFLATYGTEPSIHHEPCGDTNPARLTHAYAVAQMDSGARVFRVVTRAEIEAARDRGGSKGSGPWKTDFAAMATKTAILRLGAIIPGSSELMRGQEAEWHEQQPARGTRSPWAIEQEVPE